MTGPIITVREAKRGENSVEQGTWVKNRERQVKMMETEEKQVVKSVRSKTRIRSKSSEVLSGRDGDSIQRQ